MPMIAVSAAFPVGGYMAYRVFTRVFALLMRVLFKVRVEGLENVPESGGVILASNHLSVSDSFFLPLVLKRRVTFVAKAEYFEQKRTAWFFKLMGQIPVKRGGGTAAARALDSARDVIEAGGVFGIYPEGTRSPDGRLYKGRTGVARLAMQTGAPVLAVAMIGTAEAQPIGQVKPNFFMPITIKISKPLRFDRYAAKADAPGVARQITDEIMFELRALSGQEYTNHYAPKKGLAIEPTADEALAQVRTSVLVGVAN